MFSVANVENRAYDRFIPLRVTVHVDFNSKTLSENADIYRCKGENVINYAKIRYNYWNYQNTLRDVLLPSNSRVLNFFPPKKFTPQPFTSSAQTCPVKARKKPIMDQPETILDMPQFDSDLCHHVADWSSKNCLATIFENEVHMWYSDNNQFQKTITKTQERAQFCVKWAADGERFALSLCPNKIGIWSITDNKFTCKEAPCCIMCRVLCVEWLNENLLISGCDHGVVRLFSSRLKKQKKLRLSYKHAVVNIVKSSDKKWLALSTTNKLVWVCRMPEMKIHFKVKCSSIGRAVAWHPWSGSILAIGQGIGKTKVSIWNVNTCKEVAYEKTSYKNCEIDSLTFNPISGELAVSYFVRCENNSHHGNGIICVLNSIDSVIEELHAHTGPILYLLWGNGGKVLASISADENLFIWNFFEAEEEKISSPFEKAFISIR